VKRILTTLLILTALVSIAQADWVNKWGPKFMQYQATGRIRGAQADTLAIPLSVVQNAKWIVFQVRADSVVDSVPSFVATFGFKSLLTGAAWVNTTFATGDAGDTILPLDGSIFDTITTQTVLLPHYSTLWSIPGGEARVILTGKRAFGSSKACSVAVYVKK
jgi:hypothetical protein